MAQLKPKGNTAVNIALSVEQLIRDGSWQAGFRLPTVRALSEELGVNPNTVAAAYKRLRDGGLIATDGRRGSVVVDTAQLPHPEMAVPQGLVDLASGNVDKRLLPCFGPFVLSGYHLSTDVGHDGDNPALIGYLKNWLAERCNIHAEPILFSGSLDIIERALVQRCLPGAKVLVENPCWQPVLALLKQLRLEAVPADIDNDGAKIPTHIDMQQISAVILTPRAHNPTGICYSEARWRAWQRVLGGGDALLIIDDHWNALSRFPFYGVDGFTNEWIYSTSTSKFLGTDFRIAVAASNGPILQAMKKRFMLGPRWISKLLQHLTLETWQRLAKGQLDVAADSYYRRRTHLIRCLNEQGVTVAEQGEGLHVWLPVNNEAHLIQALAANGWAVQSGRWFVLSRQSAVRISISNLDWEDCPKLAADIAAALSVSKRTLY